MFLDNIGNSGKGFGELTFIHSPLVFVPVEMGFSVNRHMMTTSSTARTHTVNKTQLK